MKGSVAAIRVHMGYSDQEARYLGAYAERYNLPAILAEGGREHMSEVEALARIVALWRTERTSAVR